MKTIRFSTPIWKSSVTMLVKAALEGTVKTLTINLESSQDMMFDLRCILFSYFPGQDLEVYHIGAQELYNMYFGE